MKLSQVEVNVRVVRVTRVILDGFVPLDCGVDIFGVETDLSFDTGGKPSTLRVYGGFPRLGNRLG